MPTREATLRRKARKASLSDEGSAFLAFLNEGRATYREHTFDAMRCPRHAEIQRATRALVSELHRAGHSGSAPQIDDSPLAALAPTRAAAPDLPPLAQDATHALDLGDFIATSRRVQVELRARVAEHDGRIELLAEHIHTAALVAFCKAMLSHFFASRDFEAYRLIGRCRRCERWFFETHAQQAYCRPACVRLAERDQGRERAHRFRQSA